MSSSTEPLARGHLTVTSPHARISVYDAFLELVPHGIGFGRLEASLSPGAYQVRAQVGGFENVETVLVRPGGARHVELPVSYASSAPIRRALNFDEKHALLVKEEASGYHRRRTEPSLVVVIRGLDDAELAGVKYRQPFSLQAGPDVVPGVPPEEAEGDTTWAASWAFVLPTGLCRVRWLHRSGRQLEHAVWLPHAWKALLFVRWSNGGPDVGTMSLHLVPRRGLWDPDGDDEAAVEAAVATWRDAAPSGLLDSASDNPMAVLLAQHHRFRDGGTGGEADEDAVRFLKRTLGHWHPDVQALVPGLPPSPLPPMLSTSVGRVLSRRLDDGVRAPWQLFAGIAAQRFAGGPWMTWSSDGVHADAWTVFHEYGGPPTVADPPPPAVERLAELLQAMSLKRRTPAERLAREFSAAELAVRLGTSSPFVTRALGVALSLIAKREAEAAGSGDGRA